MAIRPMLTVLGGGALLLLAGCVVEEGPLAPELGAGRVEVRASLECRVQVRSGSVACAPVDPGVPAGIAGAVLGGQGVSVLLEASNVQYDSGSEIFSADVSVRNLLSQALGVTLEGEEPVADAEGVRVFFQGAPAATVGNGEVTIENADGEDVFTESLQPYFRYRQVLSPGKVSLARNWKFGVPGDVEEFTFSVYVAAEMAGDERITHRLRIDAGTIGAGEYHSCGLDLGGRAYCWGLGGSGQMGNGATLNQQTPVEVLAGGKRFSTISIGYNHACGIVTSGAVYCWGDGGAGQVGNGRFNKPTALTPDSVRLPVKRYISVSGGWQHTCVVAIDGTAYCWGNGEKFQLGHGLSDFTNTPVQVDAPGITFSSISSGNTHTCALTTAGDAYCWGSNSSGELGLGVTSDNEQAPAKVVAPAGMAFVSISAGNRYTCGITTAGAAYCWGIGEKGQLGTGNSGWDYKETAPAEVQSLAGKRVLSISAGVFHTCAVTTEGAAYCWGEGSYGRLGTGSGANGYRESTPVAVQAPAGTEFVSISAGFMHTCGTTATGLGYCWGGNYQDQIGRDDIGAEVWTPAQVAAVTTFALGDTRAGGGGEPVNSPTWTTFEAYAYAGPGAPRIPAIGAANGA